MKITKLKIESFRGIPNELTLNFADSKNNPLSTLIFGDNGSGKSSIIDALEYNLQGKIERSDSIKNEFRPSPLSWCNDYKMGSKTTIFFQDDSINKREIIVHFDVEKETYTLSKSVNKLHPNFQIAPIVLRRSDIINYSSTPIQKKQILFWSFIYKSDNLELVENLNDKVLIQNLEKDRIRLKSLRREKIKNLANFLKLSDSEIPSLRNEFISFIKNKIRGGLTPRQYNDFKNRGILKGVNEKALNLANEILELFDEIQELQKQLNKPKTSQISEIKKIETQNFLREASAHLTKAFHSISTSDFIDEISFEIGEMTDVSFEIIVKLKNGKITSPNNIFSEANLDLLILLLYTSLIKEASNYGQTKLIVLDDVLQSVDSTIRLNFLEYLLINYKDWQIIISAHDRLWLNQVRSVFRRHQHKFKEIEIFNWDFQTGPQLIEPQTYGIDNPLYVAIKTNNIQLIASQSGLLFEKICQNLSIELGTSIQRKKNDQYTIGDLWPGIIKYFKKSDLNNITIEIDKLLHIRNLLGAHYNEWAISLSNEEVLRFANCVNQFYLKTFCEDCHNWINKSDRCICGKLKMNNYPQ